MHKNSARAARSLASSSCIFGHFGRLVCFTCRQHGKAFNAKIAPADNIPHSKHKKLNCTSPWFYLHSPADTQTNAIKPMGFVAWQVIRQAGERRTISGLARPGQVWPVLEKRRKINVSGKFCENIYAKPAPHNYVGRLSQCSEKWLAKYLKIFELCNDGISSESQLKSN